MIDTVLFDFFGTLVHYSPDFRDQSYPRTHRCLRQSGVDIDYDAFLDHWAAAFEDLLAWSRQAQQEFSMHRVVEEFSRRVGRGQISGETASALIEHYVDEWSEGIRAIPAVEDVLSTLGSQYRLGLVSNTHHAKLVPRQLENLGIAGHFQAVVTSVEHGRPKPHGSIFLAALAELDSAPDRAVFVGDTYEADYLGPSRIGMRALLIGNEAPGLVPAGRRVDSIAATVEAIRRME